MEPSLLIVDAQSVKNTDSARFKGYDAGKKVSGIKRHIGVDVFGLPFAWAVTTANVTDRQGALLSLQVCKANLSEVKTVLCDGGYTGENFASEVRKIIQAEVEISKRSDKPSFVVQPKRWIVERSFGWLERSRRLWKNCERKIRTSHQMMSLAFLILLLRRL